MEKSICKKLVVFIDEIDASICGRHASHVKVEPIPDADFITTTWKWLQSPMMGWTKIIALTGTTGDKVREAWQLCGYDWNCIAVPTLNKAQNKNSWVLERIFKDEAERAQLTK